MNERLNELMPKVFELYNEGWSFLQIARHLNLNVNSVRRRILTGNKMKLGKYRYYKDLYVIKLYTYDTNEYVGTFRNANELRKFLNRKSNDFLSQAIVRKIDYVFANGKEKKYRFEFVDKDLVE